MPPFDSGCDFMIGRVQPMLQTKYEAANLIMYANIGEFQPIGINQNGEALIFWTK